VNERRRRRGRSTTQKKEVMNGHYHQNEEDSEKSSLSPSYEQRNCNNQLECKIMGQRIRKWKK